MEGLLTAENIFLLWREDKNDKKPGAHNPEKARYFKPKEKSGQAFPPPYLPPVFASLIFLLFFFRSSRQMFKRTQAKKIKEKARGIETGKKTYQGFMVTRQSYIFFRAA